MSVLTPARLISPSSALFALLLSLLAAACGGDADGAGAAAGAAGGPAGGASGAAGGEAGQGGEGGAGGGPSAGAAGEAGGAGSGGSCEPGQTRCAQSVVERCDGQGRWEAAATCALPQSCRQGACADPTAGQQAQVASLEAYVDEVLARTGYFAPLDAEAIKQPGRQLIWAGSGDEVTFVTAMRGAFLAIPQGHQGLAVASLERCAELGLVDVNVSRHGVCGRPHPEGLVVTFARADNGLGLQAGDVVLQADSDAGPALLERSSRRPFCSDFSSPTDHHRLETAAASFFGQVPAGTVLRVRRGGSEPFDVQVPAGSDPAPLSCQDPLGRAIDFDARAEVRPDGVAVIRLPRFYPLDGGPPPQTEDELAAFIAAFQARVQEAFDQVKSAPAIVWDARGNYGGISAVGLAIVAGLPGAQGGALSSCQGRIPKTSPPKFYGQKYAQYEVTPGGPFAYAGKAAVLIDGLDYSAADYFALAVATFTEVPLVGSATAGAYGGSGQKPFDVSGPPAMLATWDNNRCVDASGQPLEGRSVEPTVAVGYDPDDLAKGVDTVLERAVSLVK